MGGNDEKNTYVTSYNTLSPEAENQSSKPEDDARQTTGRFRVMLRHNGFLKQVDTTKGNNDGFLGMTNETEKEIGTSSKHVELASIKYDLINHTEPSEGHWALGSSSDTKWITSRLLALEVVASCRCERSNFVINKKTSRAGDHAETLITR